MKIDLAKGVTGALLSRSRENLGDLDKTESLFKAYRVAARINLLNPKIPLSDRLFVRMALDYYSRALQAEKKKRFVAAYSLGFPVEILYAMDIVPLQLEATGWLLTMLLGETGPILAAAGEVGVASEICSVHRLIAGAFARRMLPRPAAVLWTNVPCENCAQSGNLLAELNNCAGLLLDQPSGNTPEWREYLADEYRSAIGFLGERSGQALDFSLLTEAIDQSNQQVGLCREISALRRLVPSPFPSFTFLRVFLTPLLFGGQASGTKYLKTLRDEMVAKARKGKRKSAEEKFRLMDLNLPPLYFVGSLRDIFRQHGAVEVVNPFLLEWPPLQLDRSRPLEGLATKSLANPWTRISGGMSEQTLSELRRAVVDYKIDGAINYAHIGCGSFGGISRLVRDTLKEAGVPVLDLPCDIVDPTVATPDDMSERIAGFLEQLADR